MKSPSELTNEILNYLMSEKGLRQYEIEDIARIPRGTLCKWRKKDVNNLSSNNLGKLMLAFPQFSAEWVLRGEGQMLKGENNSSVKTPETAIQENDCVAEDGGVDVAGYERKIKLLTDENAELRRKLEVARKMVEASLR